MKLTPLDIRKHEFARTFRGYDPEEVKAFTDMVSRQWEELQDELRHAQDRVREIEGKITHYEKVEEALQEALSTAREGAKRTQENAEERARLIVEEAELKAEQINQEAGQKQHTLRHDVVQLAQRHDEITARLRHFLMSELEILARHEDDRPIGFMKLMPSAPAEALPPAAERTVATAPPPREEQPAPAAPPAEHVAEEPEAGLPSTVVPEAVLPEAVDEAGEPAPDDASRDTTYADLYARAAEAEASREPEADLLDDAEPEEAEPTWTLRSIIGGDLEDDLTEEEADSAMAPASEKERIRRILEDLD